MRVLKAVITVIVFLSCFSAGYGGQTGKIVGKCVDNSTGSPLFGVNVVLEGTAMGAATDQEGEFFIVNVRPGSYAIVATMMGYKRMRIANIKVSVDGSTKVDFRFDPTALIGETVTIMAQQPLIERDLTATSSSVSSQEIRAMPVENFQDILQLQAGVVKDNRGDLHIRGGRSSEVAYLVDGVSISDPYNGKIAVEVDQGAIQEIKVISGTFNAEYGKAMSGIVEIVTKDPEDRIHAGGTFYLGDYASSHTDLFPHIDQFDPGGVNNAQVYLTTPLPFYGRKIGLYVSVRRMMNEGWLYGQRRYNPSDSSNFQNSGSVYMEQTGDNQYVPMNPSTQYYANAKLVVRPVSNLKMSYNFLGDFSRRRNYNHLFKYNPDGDVTQHQQSFSHIVDINHMLSPSTFYSVKLSHTSFDLKDYLYEDVDDPGYVNPYLLANREDAYSFYTGGTNMNHFARSTSVDAAKFDITSQINKQNQLKSGIEYKRNTLRSNTRQANYNGLEGGGLYEASAYFNRGDYTHRPVEWAAYIQDKIELKNMTLNLGLRYDYFASNGSIPVDERDPQDEYAEFLGLVPKGYSKAEPKQQFCPRIGFAFPVSAKGVFHTSYGHFFQIPPFEYLYLNPRFAVAPGSLSTRMGNSDLKPQSTVIYEVGYQQELSGSIGIDVTGFYKDARNLLATRIVETYILGDRYALYTNADYGNIRGITFSLNKRPTLGDYMSVSFDYTFQKAEGNASDPDQEFNNNLDDPPKRSNIQVVPLNWDQQHTANFSLSYDHPRWLGFGLIGQFQSGLPYTPEIQSRESTFQNSARKPMNFNLDLRLFRKISFRDLTTVVFIKVYNLLDRKNEIDVYTDTGRAGYSLVSHYVVERREDVNTLEEWLRRPDYYSEPRKVLIGFDVEW